MDRHVNLGYLIPRECRELDLVELTLARIWQ